MPKRIRKSEDDFILKGLKKYGLKHVEYMPNAPGAPKALTAAYLDHFDRYAVTIELGPREAPVIARSGDRFVLRRDKPEKTQTGYTSIRKALNKVIFELAPKSDLS